MIWRAQAPSNIALIKYMGKTNHQLNFPTNHSLSYTLGHLITQVELELTEDANDSWQPLEKIPHIEANEAIDSKIELSEKAIQRFLNHLIFLKNHFHFSGNFIVRSGNNFPADCGLASSASSYAALTKAACIALSELTQQPQLVITQQAMLSRQGSGSSCRSFFSPWCIWRNNDVFAPSIPYQELIHQVIVVTKEKKLVSSSEAHRRVVSSDLFTHRPQRANQRLDNLLTSLEKQDWSQAYEICWQEFWDMHALFETSKPSFGYMTENTVQVLNFCRDLWFQQHDGPLITLDAGPNIHLLYRMNQIALATEIKHHFTGHFLVLSNS